MPRKLWSVLIGAGGSNIRRIESESGAHAAYNICMYILVDGKYKCVLMLLYAYVCAYVVCVCMRMLNAVCVCCMRMCVLILVVRVSAASRASV